MSAGLGLLLSYCILVLGVRGAQGQDAAPADHNAVNTRTHPGGMMEDSPVMFPKSGALPSRYPPDLRTESFDPGEPDYYLFSTPQRSLAQIKAIQAAMPTGRFTPPSNDWRHLTITRQILTKGGRLHILALGDSIVNDTMRSGWIALLREAYPKADITATVYVRGGGGCQHFRQADRLSKHVIPRRPELVFIGGISQKSVDDIGIVIDQLRAALPEVEILLGTGALGTIDPRDASALAKAPHSGTGEYGRSLRQLAEEKRCAFLDFTAPWAEYLNSAGIHPHRFYRDVVHANEFGEQVLAKILLSFLQLELRGVRLGGGNRHTGFHLHHVTHRHRRYFVGAHRVVVAGPGRIAFRSLACQPQCRRLARRG